MDFETQLNDPRSALAVDFNPGRGTLLLAFGGMRGVIGIPPFEFFQLTRGLAETNRIYLRDPHQLWYHRGLPGVGDSIDGIAAWLRQYTGHRATRRTLVFGNSGGGYAALLFGVLLQAHRVHAFVPRTFISPPRRWLTRDMASWRRGAALMFCRRAQRHYFDLKKLMRTSAHARTQFHIHYGADHRIDRAHALRVAELPRVHLHAYESADHAMIKSLKESGVLRQIVTDEVQQAAAIMPASAPS